MLGRRDRAFGQATDIQRTVRLHVSMNTNSASRSGGGAQDAALEALIAKINGLSHESPPEPASRKPAPGTAPSPGAAEAEVAAASPAQSAPAAPSPTKSSPIASIKQQPTPPRAIPTTAGFTPSRDEPWRPSEPESFQQGRISETQVEQIVLRFLLASGDAEGRQITDQVKLPFRLMEPLLSRLKFEQLLAYKSSTATGDYVYALTERGREVARGHSVDCTYYGTCPVRIDEYIASVKQQTLEGQRSRASDLKHAFRDLLINPNMLDRLGPAINSGRGMFLFGFPGNGKTSIAERVTSAFGKYIWLPRAIEVSGTIMRAYDPMSHVLEMPETNEGIMKECSFDQRWVRIRRPTLIVGGELTMDMLEVRHDRESGISESPLQLKSNCGTLLIDDFGRQRISVDELLNRWIIPLEKRYDFLNLPSGKKVQVPFDQLVVFSTNLEPKDLVDDAFLRRIPYKIEVPDPGEADFRKLFEIMCRVLKIPYRPEPIDYLIKTHYLPIKRPFRNCQPRDLLLQVRNYCLYHDLEIELKNEYFDFAVDNYFSVM